MTEFFTNEWVNWFIRGFHVIAGIMWIGATLAFMRMGRNIIPRHGDPNIIGDVAGVHGGAIALHTYFRRLPPGITEEQLHWYKFESLATWGSGVLLLVSVYWLGGAMVEEQENLPAAIIIAISVLVGGVLVYQFLWRLIPPGKHERNGAVFCYVVLFALGYALCKQSVLSDRAAYLHVGAMLGTIMVSNVWLIILPSQRQMLAVIARGELPNEALSSRAKRCSRQNTFMMVPTVLLMVSTHAPVAGYASDYNWLVLACLVLVGWCGAWLIIKKL